MEGDGQVRVLVSDLGLSLNDVMMFENLHH